MDSPDRKPRPASVCDFAKVTLGAEAEGRLARGRGGGGVGRGVAPAGKSR